MLERKAVTQENYDELYEAATQLDRLYSFLKEQCVSVQLTNGYGTIYLCGDEVDDFVNNRLKGS